MTEQIAEPEIVVPPVQVPPIHRRPESIAVDLEEIARRHNIPHLVQLAGDVRNLQCVKPVHMYGRYAKACIFCGVSEPV